MADSGRWFDDFTIGETFTTRGVTVTESSILDFALQYDPQRFHLDVEAAAASPYGGLIASGFHTMVLAFRMFTHLGLMDRSSIGSPGMDEIRWLAPVRPNDTLHTVVEVLETRASRSKPDRGIVVLGYTVRNQRDEPVMTFKINALALRDPDAREREA
jgi:acyl dehydratase